MARRPPAPEAKRVLFIPDAHVPYEDKRAFALMLKAAEDWKPTVIVILGDFADFYSVSEFSKNPGRVRMLDEELVSVNERLSQLDALGATKKLFIEGNHEFRLQRFLEAHAPQLANLLSVRDAFKLAERGWSYVPYRHHVQLGKLYITHDTGRAGARANVQSMQDFQSNVCIGHTHRMAVSYESNARGEPHVGAMFGWLGDVEQVDYMHRIRALREWQLGFGIGRMEPDGVVHLQAVPIVAYRCTVEGKVFSL